jgi:hypothetical protein
VGAVKAYQSWGRYPTAQHAAVVPLRWPIMWAIRHVPERLFKRLSL